MGRESLQRCTELQIGYKPISSLVLPINNALRRLRHHTQDKHAPSKAEHSYALLMLTTPRLNDAMLMHSNNENEKFRMQISS